MFQKHGPNTTTIFFPCYLSVSAETKTQMAKSFFSSLLLFNFGEPVQIVVCFLFLVAPGVVSAAVAYLLQGFMCCAFRETFLQTLVIKNCY